MHKSPNISWATFLFIHPRPSLNIFYLCKNQEQQTLRFSTFTLIGHRNK